MSHLGDVVWLSQNPSADPMGEFMEEDEKPTRPLPSSLFPRMAAVVPVQAAAPATPPAIERAASPAQRRGRWVAGIAALGVLTLVQAPFVVLWALQSTAAPIAIQIAKPPMPFASVAPVAMPNERTLLPASRPAAPVVVKQAPLPGPLSGWLRVDVPVVMRISEDGRLLGTTDVDRLMLPTGNHVLDLRSDELGFATRQMTTIKPGETSIVPVRLPTASISINAKPWAEAWVDGERVGETPIGTLVRTIGRHEILLRHPELGERRVPVFVTLAQPARVRVDFRSGK